MNQVFKIVTDRILEDLKNNLVPWQKKWKSAPSNWSTKKAYQGINVLLLMRGVEDHGNSWFMTKNQGNAKGYQLKKNQKPYLVTYYKPYEVKVKTDHGEKIETRMILRYYLVFNVSQFENFPVESTVQDSVKFPFEVFQSYLKRENIPLKSGSPSYSPVEDSLYMPTVSSFDSQNDYLQVAFHEAVHSTGLDSRLGRFGKDSSPKFGSDSYSKEELIAEIGSNFLCNLHGVEFDTQNSSSYISSWLKVLTNNPSIIVSAASKAQKAVDFISKEEK